MLTRLHVRNLKRLDDADIELGQAVVLIGPNNSGKTTALQALALWEVGLRKWLTRWRSKTPPRDRPAVTLNRNDLISVPVPNSLLLWHEKRVRAAGTTGKPNILVDVTVEGVTDGAQWTCGLEFDYANAESIYCRALRLGEGARPDRMLVPQEAESVRVAFLPPMSGLAAVEPKLEPGRVNVLLGEGQTAQVLRNLCYQVHGETGEPSRQWHELVQHIQDLFGVRLRPPRYAAERGEILMSYLEPNEVELDLASAGRGLQQTLLLLAHLYANPGTVLLLDEPDAHLEILRQRQTYALLTDVAEQHGSQVIAASHSEVVLNEAADKDIVVAFVGKPHRIDDRGNQVLKALRDIGYDHYYQAEQTGWVLYLEGSTDLSILRAFAHVLQHEAAEVLERPFVHYVGNQPTEVRKHFWGLREAKSDLVGIAIFDRLDRDLPDDLGADGIQWQRRELENYLCTEDVLVRYARQDDTQDLFGRAEADNRESTMRGCIQEVTALLALDEVSPWSPDIKASDEFLNRLFRLYFRRLELPNLMAKRDYHVLARLVHREEVAPEIADALDSLVRVARRARPTADS